VSTREHVPRPGVTWQQQPARVETVVRDDDGTPWSFTPWLEPEPPRPFEPPAALNRADRRRDKRAQRKGGKR
jgi:hypothetical protein